MGCKVAIIEDGSTWTGSKERPDPRGAKGEYFGYGDYSPPQTQQHLPAQGSVEA